VQVAGYLMNLPISRII